MRWVARAMGWASVAVGVGVGCVAPSAERPTIEEPSAGLAHPNQACPLGLGGVDMAVQDTDAGVDIYFMSTGHVDELQRRVRDVAAMHGPGAHMGMGHAGKHDGRGKHGLLLWAPPLVRVTVNDSDTGATLHLSAVDPAQRDEVRQTIRQRTVRLALACD
jgi:hypothetical protein